METAMTENEDRDLCSEQELNAYFPYKSALIDQIQVTKSDYILHVSGTGGSIFKVITSDSGRNIYVYDFSNGRIDCTNTSSLDSDIVNVKTCPTNENLFFVGTENCEIRLYDLRQSSQYTSIFKDTTKESGTAHMPLTCFDASTNNVLLCGGTELYDGDSYVLFWDIRNTKLMGAYWESHTDDITQVKFHPVDSNKLMSGSVDGLINIYDLTEPSPDDALIETFNTDLSVDRLYWFENDYEHICCLTHTDDVQLWQVDGAAPYADFRRDTFTKAIQRESEDFTYIADAYVNRNRDLSILAGSTFENGECLRAIRVQDKHLLPRYNFKGSKQKVRSCWFNQTANLLVTGGEEGWLTFWDIDENSFQTVKPKKKCPM